MNESNILDNSYYSIYCDESGIIDGKYIILGAIIINNKNKKNILKSVIQIKKSLNIKI